MTEPNTLPLVHSAFACMQGNGDSNNVYTGGQGVILSIFITYHNYVMFSVQLGMTHKFWYMSVCKLNIGLYLDNAADCKQFKL